MGAKAPGPKPRFGSAYNAVLWGLLWPPLPALRAVTGVRVLAPAVQRGTSFTLGEAEGPGHDIVSFLRLQCCHPYNGYSYPVTKVYPELNVIQDTAALERHYWSLPGGKGAAASREGWGRHGRVALCQEGGETELAGGPGWSRVAGPSKEDMRDVAPLGSSVLPGGREPQLAGEPGWTRCGCPPCFFFL